jgi:protein-tyrosine phosphatase
VADGENVLRDLYVGLVDHAATRIGELFTGLGDDDGLPAVFHCHAGKDRTGVVAALLLEALGVERETVLDDYELTARYRLRTHQAGTHQRLLDLGMSPEAAAGVLTTPRWAMQEALHHLDDRHGGVERYLTGPAGMTPATLARLRRVLVEERREAVPVR